MLLVGLYRTLYVDRETERFVIKCDAFFLTLILKHFILRECTQYRMINSKIVYIDIKLWKSI